MSAVEDFLIDLRDLRDRMPVKWGAELAELLDAYKSDVLTEAEHHLAPLASGDTANVGEAREAIRQHVVDLECTPEWLRPELRHLLHEGRLT